MVDAAHPAPGLGVDSHGQPVIDPTANVIALVEAGLKRQDDLREMTAAHVREMAELRAEYDEKLRKAESQRIDAIREVDVGNVTRAAEATAAQASILANQVVSSAEALRVQVEATRQQTATTLGAALEPIQKDVADLRRVQYEQQGQKVAQVDARGGNQYLVTTLVSLLVLAVLVAGFIVAYTAKP